MPAVALRRIMPTNLVLLLIGVLDLATTVFWIQTGRAVEFNPVMAAALEIGLAYFICLKLSTLVAYVGVVEWYRRCRRPEFAATVSNLTLAAYVCIYSISFVCVNGHVFL